MASDSSLVSVCMQISVYMCVLLWCKASHVNCTTQICHNEISWYAFHVFIYVKRNIQTHQCCLSHKTTLIFLTAHLQVWYLINKNGEKGRIIFSDDKNWFPISSKKGCITAGDSDHLVYITAPAWGCRSSRQLS